MRTMLKRSAVALAIIAVLFSSTLANVELASSAGPGGEVDVFTQKAPFNGRGANASSDAFEPDEMVQVFALVTYNEYPAQGIPVAFEILGPDNPNGQIVFFRSGMTDENGTVMISFRLPYLNGSASGLWAVHGSAKIADSTFSDMVLFQVGWIVEIGSIRTVDEHHEPQENFMRGNSIGIELILRSIAMVEKRTTLTITIYDERRTWINSTEIDDLIVPPNYSLVYFYSSLYIPESAFLGDACAYASAYTAPPALGGMPYCPEVSTHFLIISRDVAILSVQPSSSLVYEGEIVNVDVSVGNKGWETESFNVHAYYNGTLIGTMPIFGLTPFSDTSLRFAWNTTAVQDGFYLISAAADPVPDEADLSDNTFDDGFVEVKLKPAPPLPPPPNMFHDVAVLNVYPSSYLAYIGDVVEISVVVKNLGNCTESFNVTVLTDSVVVMTSLVQNLGPGAERMIVFSWDTSHVPEGDYMLSALASYVPGEVDYENNRYVDGTVRVAAAPRREFVPDWFYWFLLLLLLILIGILLSAWLYRRRKKSEAAFYSGWTAWYYGYDLRGRNTRTFGKLKASGHRRIER